MQQNDRTLIDMERLTRASSARKVCRAATDTESKLADAQSKLEQIEYQLRRRALSALRLWHNTSRGGREHAVASWKTKSRACWPRPRYWKPAGRVWKHLCHRDAEVDTLRRKIEYSSTAGSFGATKTQRPKLSDLWAQSHRRIFIAH